MENHRHCKHLLASLSDYVDGELQEALCDELEQHLLDCEDCRIVVDTLKKTVYLYHAAGREPVSIPVDVRERLFKRLELEEYLE